MWPLPLLSPMQGGGWTLANGCSSAEQPYTSVVVVHAHTSSILSVEVLEGK